MRSALRRLDVRLFVSHAAVALVGALAVAVVVRTTAPGLFDEEMRRRAGAMGQGRGAAEVVDARESLLQALNVALLIGAVAAVVAAAVLAVVVTRRILGPLGRVREAAGRMAGGDYAVEVPVPPVVELAELAEDVNRLGAELHGTEQRRAALVADLAHELRTPLTTVRGFLEGLTDGVFEPTPEVLADLTEEVERLQRLVGDLSTLSRAEEGALALDLHDEDVAGLAEAVASRLGPQFADKEVDLQVDAPEPARALVDADRVTQLLTNVVGNALAYTPGGGRVEVAVAVHVGQVAVEVRDTGRGIPADELPLLFDRFHRGDRSVPGTGLGLTIARGIARAHGGDVVARSAGPGQGSTFVVSLPVAGPRRRNPDRHAPEGP